MRAITSKLEIDVHRSDVVNPTEVIDFAKRHGCAAVIVDPDMFDVFYITKIKRGGEFELGLMVDFPLGDSNHTNKLTNLSENAMESADCMDIMFRDNMHTSNYKIEIDHLQTTIADFVSPTTEVRPVIDFSRSDESVSNILGAFKTISVKRVRSNKSVNMTGADHSKQITKIREFTPRPITISGGVTLDTIRNTINTIGPGGRYAVSYEQAKNIIRALESEEKHGLVSGDDIVIEPDPPRQATTEDLNTIVKRHTLDVLQSIPGATGVRVIADDENSYLEITTDDGQSNLEAVVVRVDEEEVEAKVKVV